MYSPPPHSPTVTLTLKKAHLSFCKTLCLMILSAWHFVWWWYMIIPSLVIKVEWIRKYHPDFIWTHKQTDWLGWVGGGGKGVGQLGNNSVGMKQFHSANNAACLVQFNFEDCHLNWTRRPFVDYCWKHWCFRRRFSMLLRQFNIHPCLSLAVPTLFIVKKAIALNNVCSPQ